tara:strand:+ start:158 stop:685 length:528 start_codon:yes stop_codon:yes gene_type:complete
MICVYKITCLIPNINWCYVGSTKNYHKRKSEHKRDCYNKKNPKYNKKTYCFIRENGGFDNFQFEIIEKFEKYDKLKLHERELYYIDKTWNINSNQRRPCTKDDNRLTRKKEYRENNKEKISQKIKEYRENNKELISFKGKIKINCNFCNRLVRKHGIKRHQRTKYCLNIQSNLKK